MLADPMDIDTETAAPQSLTGAAKEKLRQTVERIERLAEEKQQVSDQIKEVYAEAKALGYDTKAIREVVKQRKIDAQTRAEMEMVTELYLLTVGEK